MNKTESAKWDFFSHFQLHLYNRQTSANLVWSRDLNEVRDRPFNLQGWVMVFCFVQNFFFGQHRVRILIFFQNLTLGYMTKTLNQIIIFFLHQNQNIFFSNIGNQNIFLEKKHNPPFKLNGRSLMESMEVSRMAFTHSWKFKIIFTL
jgi:hypothetical protein